MKKDKVAFVILHYCAIDMTYQCVDVIKNTIKDDNYEIVIVDNASPNGTGKTLYDSFEQDGLVTVILSEENVGFAKGNNLGVAYAKDYLNCEFFCVMNNDVMMEQALFCKYIRDEYEKSRFAILGPHISLADGSENAMYYKIADISHLEKERNGYIKRLKQMKSSMYRFWMMYEKFLVALRIFLGKIHVMPELKLHEEQIEGCLDRQENIVLHGCCIIFSSRYFEYYKEAFSPETFMFREEEILHLRCKEKKLPIIYNPDLKVQHLEDVATNLVYKTNRTKEIFHLENQIESLGILIRFMKEAENE